MLMRPELIDPVVPLPLQQSAPFLDALRAMGRQAVQESLGGAGQAVVISRRIGPFGTLRFTSRGPVWATDAMPTDRVAALAGSGLHVINAEFADDIVMRAAGFRQIATPAVAGLLPLCADKDQQLAQAHQKWRNAARKLTRSGMRIAQPAVTPALLGWLHTVEALQQRQKRYKALPAALNRALAAANPADIHVFTANRGNTVHAAIMILRHGAGSTYHLAWSDSEGRACAAHHGLIMHAAQWLARHGVSQLDLGLIDTVNAPGLARFKIGTGATIKTLGGTWLRLMPRRPRP